MNRGPSCFENSSHLEDVPATLRTRVGIVCPQPSLAQLGRSLASKITLGADSVSRQLGKSLASATSVVRKNVVGGGTKLLSLKSLPHLAVLRSRIPYEEVPYKPPKLPGRQKAKGYQEPKVKHQGIAQRW